MRKLLCGLFAPVLVCLCASIVHADLVLEIYSANGGNATRWEFSGSDTMTGGTGEFSIGALSGFPASEWANIGNYTGVNNTNFGIISGSATISRTRIRPPQPPEVITRDIVSHYIDTDFTPGGDDFGISVSGASDLSIGIGDLVEWSGTQFSNVAYTDLTVGTYNASDFGTGSLALTIVVAVPEPSGLALAAFGVVGIAFRRRRR